MLHRCGTSELDEMVIPTASYLVSAKVDRPTCELYIDNLTGFSTQWLKPRHKLGGSVHEGKELKVSCCGRPKP